MNIIRKSEANLHQNSPVCNAYEYALGGDDINAALIELSGRYPEEGRVVNEVCREIVYVIDGSGRVVIEDNEIELFSGDQVLIEQNEKYYFDGIMTLLTPCAPAWYQDQHKNVE